MKKVLLSFVFLGITLISKAQDVSVEKSIFGIQTGFLGVWAHNETKLSNEVALRSEIGFDTGIFGGSFYDGIGFIFIPVLTLEPKWYYDLQKRNAKSKTISGNSGNFISLKSSYHPDWFAISTYENIRVINQIAITPTWGLRRNLTEHFNYEAGIGLGYRYIFVKNAGLPENRAEATLNLHLRIGYRF